MKVNTFFHKVTILENQAAHEIDPENWQKKCEIYAEIKPVYETNIGEIAGMNFGHVISGEYYLFTTRFVKGLSNKMRLQFGSKVYEIKRIINDKMRNKFLKIIALQI